MDAKQLKAMSKELTDKKEAYEKLGVEIKELSNKIKANQDAIARQVLLDAGIDPNTVLAAAKPPKFKSLDGKEVWTGIGKGDKPEWIKALIASNGKLLVKVKKGEEISYKEELASVATAKKEKTVA